MERKAILPLANKALEDLKINQWLSLLSTSLPKPTVFLIVVL
jgi:hypothetical protein